MAKLDYEQVKIFNDYIKHINTLSTGSILLMVTFLEKIFTNPHQKWLVIISLIMFLTSIIGGVLLKTILSANALDGIDENYVDKSEILLKRIGVLIMWIGFLLGIISLGIFGIINLIQ
jgi:hypothetical protein